MSQQLTTFSCFRHQHSPETGTGDGAEQSGFAEQSDGSVEPLFDSEWGAFPSCQPAAAAHFPGAHLLSPPLSPRTRPEPCPPPFLTCMFIFLLFTTYPSRKMPLLYLLAFTSRICCILIVR